VFTGIITAVGTVRRSINSDGGRDLDIDAPWLDLAPGESISVDGACLTAARSGEGWFGVHVVATSLARTNFERYVVGRRVNLERALRAGDRFGGHLVQGHVDGVGRIGTVTSEGDARVITIAVPPEITDVSVPLGSVTVDGVALTVNAIPAPGTIRVALIPFTLEHTTLGDLVHVEGDLVGKYVRQLWLTRSGGEAGR